MEDSQEKLDLMLRFYVGGHNPITAEPTGVLGFGARWATIQDEAYLLLRGIDQEETTTHIRMRYRTVQDAYENLPFYELDESHESDPYFQAVLKTRDLIPQFVSALEKFIAKPTHESLDEVKDVSHQMSETDRPSLRRRIWDLYEKLYGKPCPYRAKILKSLDELKQAGDRSSS